VRLARGSRPCSTADALVNANSPSPESHSRLTQVYSLVNHYAWDFLASGHTALSYLCFPFLEAVTRRACAAFVDLNGTVRQPFAGSRGRPYQVGQPCSNLAHLLRLLRDQVANQTLQADLTELLGHVARIAKSSDGCFEIFVWRNSSLHGETTHQTIGGTIYALALLIALDGIKEDYLKFRADAIERMRQEALMISAAGPNARSP
jgi:hypothetical protein